ncbi:haloacid dehalogenase [Bryobacterales bacterium F-183]|nr:haloacid dehalogenase [Bryobacterales bacterium F-183]
MSYDAVLFDFDGVLADSEPLHYEVWCEVLAPFGFEMDWETYVRECIGISDRLMVERFCATKTPPLDFETIYALYPTKKEILSRRMIEKMPFLAETVRLLNDIALPMAVVSSSSRNEVELPLLQAGIRDRFSALVCGLEAGKLKPAPDPYLMGAEMLGALRPLVVEDSEAGELSGKTAGFDVVRVSSPQEVAPKVRAALGI